MIRTKAKPKREAGQPVEPCSSCDARPFSICSSLAEPQLGTLADAATPIEVDAGSPLVVRGEPAAHVFNISSGAVQVFKLLPDGRRQIVGFLSRGDFLGFASPETYTYEAEALTPVTACRFARADFMALLDRFPAMERRLLCMASHEIREDHEQMLLLGRKTALERVASFLRQQARRAARFGGSGDVAALPMTRTDIADYLGVTPETVSRVLSQLRARGVISLGADAAQILKPAALAALAEGETAPAA